jgi:hypothetical protein
MTGNQLNARPVLLTEQDQVSGGASDNFFFNDSFNAIIKTTGSTSHGNGGVEGTPPGNGTTNVHNHFPV